MSEMIERVARAMWEVRRQKAGLVPVELEPWGDGSIPRANHIMDEARAALEAMLEEASDLADLGGDVALYKLREALQ
jgi:hypothetical protein